jgi:hypothetical protein
MNPVILLTDDNEDILDFLSNDLCDKYNLFTALNGKQALGNIKSRNRSSYNKRCNDAGNRWLSIMQRNKNQR